LLRSLAERQFAKSEAVDRRLLTLQREVVDSDERLKRLYRSIEGGIVELDDILRDRTATLKSERERAKAALDRARSQCGTAIAIDREKIDAFSQLMIDKLENGDVNARKGYSLGKPRQLLDKALLTIGPQRQQPAALRLEDARDRFIDGGLAGGGQRRCPAFPQTPRPVTVRVGITSLSRVRDVKFTETELNFL
jgi:site-specific DNA recombinase